MSSLKRKEFRMEDGTITVEYHDEHNVLRRLEDLGPDGEIEMSVDYDYDSAGNNCQRIVRDQSGAQHRRLEFRFDESGHEIEHREYDKNDKLQFVLKPEDTGRDDI